MQINLTGFLNAKNARIFQVELWDLLCSAQENDAGIPTQFLEQKKEEIKKRQVGSNNSWYFTSQQMFLCSFYNVLFRSYTVGF